MYCVNCGVKLADTEKTCPLCGTMAWHPEQIPGSGEPLYPGDRYPAPQVSPKGAQIIVTTMFLIPILITLLCDFRINGAVTWSGYVTGALLLGYLVCVLPSWFRRPNPVVLVACDFVGLGLYLLYINFAAGGDWFLSFAFPLVGYVGAVVTAVAALLRYVRRGRLWIFGGALIALGAFMPVMELLVMLTFSGVRFTGWSGYPLIALALPGAMLLFLAGNRRARENMERKFFL